MRILFVHGIAQEGKDPVKLNKLWQDTLSKGLVAAGLEIPDGVTYDFPYYGDELYKFKTDSTLPSIKVLAKGNKNNYQYEAFLKAALEEITSKFDMKKSEAEYQEKGIQNWGWIQSMAQEIDELYTDTSEYVIEKFLRDVYLYVNSPGVTDSINRIVEKFLTNEPTLIVGHSLGSVIAYNIIKNNPELHLHKFITVGSPLGIKAISTKLGIPENTALKGWYNAYDEKDIVALNPLDDIYFPTDPPIINNNSVDNQTDNRHGVIGYLSDPEIAKAIVDGLN